MPKKKKKQKRIKVYNKKVFVNTICSACKVCGDNPNPVFCYSLYRDNPTGFINHSFKKLSTLTKWAIMPANSFIDSSDGLQNISNTNYSAVVGTSDTITFREIFCKADACSDGPKVDGDICPLLEDCIMAHRQQIYSSMAAKTSNNIKGVVMPEHEPAPPKLRNVKKTKKRERYVAKPYATFFGSKGMEAEIDKLLSE